MSREIEKVGSADDHEDFESFQLWSIVKSGKSDHHELSHRYLAGSDVVYCELDVLLITLRAPILSSRAWLKHEQQGPEPGLRVWLVGLPSGSVFVACKVSNQRKQAMT